MVPTVLLTTTGAGSGASRTVPPACVPRLIDAWPAYDTYVERNGGDLRVFRLDRA